MSTAAKPAWPRVRLGDIGQSLTGLTYEPKDVKRGGTLVLRSSNIQDDSLDLDDRVYVDREIPERIRVRENDILICVRNGSRRLIGKSVLLDRRAAGQTFGAFMAVYRSQANPFLQYFFQSSEFKRQIDAHLGATINQITHRSLNNFVVALPSPAEQAAITERLGDIDAYITGLTRLITKKRAIKQSMMQQLLTGRSRLPGFAGRWSERRLGDFARVSAGGTPSTSVERYWGGTVPWMTSGEVHQKQILTVRGRISEDGLRESSARLFPPGTVLVALAGQGKTRGTVAVSRIPLATNQSIAGILPSSVHDANYLYFNLDSRYSELRGESAGEGGRGGLNLKIINSLKVPCPGIQEQRAIAEVLMDGYLEIDSLLKKLAKARSLKLGMMQELLSGRTRLSVEVQPHE